MHKLLHIAREPRAVSKGGIEQFQDYKACREEKANLQGKDSYSFGVFFNRIKKYYCKRCRGTQIKKLLASLGNSQQFQEVSGS